MTTGHAFTKAGTALNGVMLLGYAHPTAAAVAATTLFFSLLMLLLWPSAEPCRRLGELIAAARSGKHPVLACSVSDEYVRCQDGGGRAGPPR